MGCREVTRYTICAAVLPPIQVLPLGWACTVIGVGMVGVKAKVGVQLGSANPNSNKWQPTFDIGYSMTPPVCALRT